MWIKDPVTGEYSKKINRALAGHCLVCAVQIASSHRTAWESFHGVLGPAGVSLITVEDQVCARVERWWREKNIFRGNATSYFSVNCTNTEDHSSFPHWHPVPFPLGDNSSFWCFIHCKWIALSTSGVPRVVFLYMSYLCEPSPQLLLPLMLWRGELFLLYYFFYLWQKQAITFKYW